MLCSWREVGFSAAHKFPSLPKWSPPVPGKLKLNFDGSTRTSLVLFAIGGIIRDSSAGFILASFRSVGFCSVNEAEMLAFRMRLRQATRLGLSDIIAEGDYFCAIAWASGSFRPPLQMLLRGLWSWGSSSICPSCISSGRLEVANALAGEGVGRLELVIQILAS